MKKPGLIDQGACHVETEAEMLIRRDGQEGE
jgi:hypothetical protein